MASIILASAGSAIGASIGGGILGVSSGVIGGAIGSMAGSLVDSWIVSSLAPGQTVEGARLENLAVTTSTEGAVIPRVWGRMRLGGNIIWATDFTETVSTSTTGGGKGGGPKVTTTTYTYTASFAVALCEGPISGIGRVWADGKPLDLSGMTWRLYKGNETQVPDPFIEAKMGTGNAPAYRGTAYVMFEDLPLEKFGNRIPQLSFEIFRPLVEADTAEGMVKSVTMIPGSGEFVYATEPITRGTGGNTTSENVNNATGKPDILASLDNLKSSAPAVQNVSLVVSWFGLDLRVGNCQIKPGVETATKTTAPKVWGVNGVTRSGAHLISTDGQGKVNYGGTPADFSVVQAIKEMKARGLRVTFYPFLLMDIPAGNTLPDPYSDNAATVGQPAHPWRGRITCSPAAGYVGTVDKTAAAAAQVNAFFGNAQVSDFVVSGETVTWTGGNDWGYRRMILHYAHLCKAAGGVDAFLIGSELVGLTTIRDSATGFPAVAAMKQLAADVRAILGSGNKISYAADWSEYFGHQPDDGSGDALFHLDPLWADANIDFIGIDNYLPLSDWRDGTDHLDAQAGWASVRDLDYLKSNIEGGEGYDWFYASSGDRDLQNRTTIADVAYSKPWVFRFKDIRSWWSNQHFDRPGGVEKATSTAWVPQSNPIRFTEFGCPAVDRGTNQPNVFYDPKSSESALPYYSRGWPDEAVQRAYIEATLGFWGDGTKNPVSSVYGAPMIEIAEAALWTWDARPYPDFPARADVWSDAANWRLGHWMGGRLGQVSLGALVRDLCRAAGLDDTLVDVSELSDIVPGFTVAALESPRASIAVLARHFGFDAVESGGRIVFRARGRAPSVTVAPDQLVANGSGEVLELTRGQETELPQALKWQLVRADEEYDAATVEARRSVVQAARVFSESFPLAVSLEEADRRCRRALMEAWVGREALTARLPPSMLRLDPGDVIALEHDGRQVEYRLTRINDAGPRAIEALRADAALYDLPPGKGRAPQLATPTVFGPAEVALMDLPQLSDAVPAHRPYAAVFARPWYGTGAVWRSADTSGFQLLDTIGAPARLGVLAADLPAGPVDRFDAGSELLVDLSSGTLTSVTDTELLNGANVLAVESAPGVWEIVQFGNAELVSTGRYRLTRLLRGQRGTEDAMGNPAPTGARVVILDTTVQPLSIAEADLGIPWNWRIGPGTAAPSDAIMQALSFTPNGRGLMPFAPAQPRMRRAANGDLAIRWLRRDRALAADSWVLAEVPMSEASEAYDLEILSGGSVVRTVAGLTAPSFLYTAADQTADFGGDVGSVDVRIYQIGALGRGVPLVTTLAATESV
ncbi:MAG: glycoside hydrolase TIM-barrel-like domain-containing protein [Paracoccaceae bacterium]|jgi:hypothetical protein|nr:glycoside hydrolase TIM-barrel-like domain-containing protein [Paracoccaceae bacterium]